MSSINLVNNSILSTTRKETNKVENYIRSNECISNASYIVQCKATFPRRDNILQKQASFIHNSRNGTMKSLKHHPSKLDLIDDTKLTSLPLPPPPSKSRNSIISQGTKVEEDRCSNEMNSVITKDRNDDFDEEMEESEDPIVLIEDYLANKTNINKDKQKHINKKDSLAAFKDRIYKKDDTSSLSRSSAISTISNGFVKSIPPETAIASDETVTNTKISKREQNLEEIFGKIPGSDSLKYCDLCEKPLYEISSIIDNNVDTFLNVSTSEAVLPKENNQLYREFVCWECIGTYEEFANELCTNELETNNDNTYHEMIGESNLMKNESIGLLEMFQEINQKYNNQYIKKDPMLSGADKQYFSTHLIGKLYQLNNMKENTSLKIYNEVETFEWVKYLQYQLRWRWRIAGLIPNAFRSDPSQS